MIVALLPIIGELYSRENDLSQASDAPRDEFATSL